jgi:hypothetical protein
MPSEPTIYNRDLDCRWMAAATPGTPRPASGSTGEPRVISGKRGRGVFSSGGPLQSLSASGRIWRVRELEAA